MNRDREQTGEDRRIRLCPSLLFAKGAEEFPIRQSIFGKPHPGSDATPFGFDAALVFVPPFPWSREEGKWQNGRLR